MINTTPDSISIRTSLRFEKCLCLLRQKLQKEQFHVVSQVDLHREFENELGTRLRPCSQDGVMGITVWL